MAETLTGKIYRVVSDKGFCFVRTPGGKDWFLHRSELRNVAFTDLAEGMAVEFSPVPDAPKGPRAVDARVV